MSASLGDLTWDDLNKWAGKKVVARGQSYKCNVEDLRRTAEGELVAWVNGTDQYATRVAMMEDGELLSDCTCPYMGMCKHAVAVILVSSRFGEEQ